MGISYERMITLVKDHKEYNSGLAGDKIAKELGMDDGYEFNFFADIFLELFAKHRLQYGFKYLYEDVMNDIFKCHRENLLALFGGKDEEITSEFVDDHYVRFNNHIDMYIPHVGFSGFFVDSEENIDAVITELLKFKSEIELRYVHDFIEEHGELYEREDEYIEMQHEIANKVLG